MYNIFHFFITRALEDLTDMEETEYIFGNWIQRYPDYVTYDFVHAMRYKGKTPIRTLNEKVIANIFMSPETKEALIDGFCNFKRVINAFSKLARLFKVKRAKQFDIDCDLYTTPFDALPPSALMTMYDDHTRTTYRFRISDLMSLAHTALTNAPDFFITPVPIRNPYTNIKFTKAQLYHIYFCLKKSTLVIPSIFHQLFLANFKLRLFLKRNECTLVDMAISGFIKNSSDKEKLEHLLDMMDRHNYNINIHENFPADKLVSVLKPYLQDYIISTYSLSPIQKMSAIQRIEHKMARFYLLNPLFGRKVYERGRYAFIDTVHSATYSE